MVAFDETARINLQRRDQQLSLCTREDAGVCGNLTFSHNIYTPTRSINEVLIKTQSRSYTVLAVLSVYFTSYRILITTFLWDIFLTAQSKRETTLVELWDNFETTLVELWDNFETTSVVLWDNLATILGPHSDYFK